MIHPSVESYWILTWYYRQEPESCVVLSYREPSRPADSDGVWTGMEIGFLNTATIFLRGIYAMNMEADGGISWVCLGHDY